MLFRSKQTSVLEVWLRNLARGTESRFTFGPRTNGWPQWSPDGDMIAFSSDREGRNNVYTKSVTEAGKEQVVDGDTRDKVVTDWTRDGRYLVEMTRAADADIWLLPLFGDRKPFVYLQTPFQEQDAKVSPDGKWLAYSSNESGRREVYVQTFPMPGGKSQISVAGGDLPVWSRDGKELYFFGNSNLSNDSKMMAVDVKSGAKFEAGTPKALFPVTSPSNVMRGYSVTKDGRFIIPMFVGGEAEAPPITMIMNWPATLKR